MGKLGISEHEQYFLKVSLELEVGDKIDLLFHYNADCMLKNGWSHIGISDYFGRTHWANSKQVKEAIDRWKKDFGKPT